MGPKKSETKKRILKKATTMTATAADGQEFLKKVWGEDKLSQVNAMLDARDKSESNTDEEPSTSTTPAVTTTTSSVSTAIAPSTSKAKPKLSKARTMKSTAKEAKALIGKEALGETRSETKRRQAAVNAKKALEEVSKPASKRKPTLKRLGTMANTAQEGKAFVQRTSVKSAKGKTTTGRKRTGGRKKNSG